MKRKRGILDQIYWGRVIVIIAIPIFLIIAGIIVKDQVVRINNYIASQSEIRESEKKELLRIQKEKEEEQRIAEIKKQQYLAHQEAEKKALEREIKDRQDSAEYIEKLVRNNKYPKGTYVKNTNGEVGRCVMYQELDITTDTGFTFNYYDESIELASYIEYSEYRKKQDKTIKYKELEELTKESEELKPHQEQMIKEMFPRNPKYWYVKDSAGVYRGNKYDGLYLVSEKGIYLWYQDVENIGYNEYSDIRDGRVK